MIWDGRLTPTALSDSYRIRLTYSLEDHNSPRVFMIDPAMRLVDGALPEHVYKNEDGRLCLFLPRSGEWNQAKPLADTIVPWASEWLLHYEIWLGTGKWCGGGVHPVRKSPAKATNPKNAPQHEADRRPPARANEIASAHDQPREG